jgi:hypothetical protein
MAEQSGLSKSTVGRIWKAFGLKPHLIDTFKISNDPQFIDKVRDVVGLYLDPRAPRGADVSSGGERPSPPGLSQRDGGAEGSPTREMPVRVGSSPDNAGTCQHRQMGWVRQA